MTGKALGCLLCLFLLLAAASPARAEAVDVRFGRHDDYTRIVFDFPRLVAYQAVQKTDSEIELIFDTPLALAAFSRLPAGVGSFQTLRPDDSTLKVRIGVAGAVKHYRLMKKVVVDVYTPGAAPRRQAEKPPPAPEKKQAEKQAEEKKAPEPPVEKIAKTAPAPAPEEAEKAAPPQEEAREEAREEVSEDNATKIVVSAAVPVRLAVFRRFGTLWIVADSEAVGAFAPEVSGPQAGFLGAPKLFRFEGGAAWRYIMPPRSYVKITKSNLTWNVHIMSGPPKKIPTSRVEVETDRVSGKAKLRAHLPGAGQVLTFEDPAAGDVLHVVPVGRENVRVSTLRRFPDVEILPADMGLLVRPLRPAVRTHRLGDYVAVSAPDGLWVTPDAAASVVALNPQKQARNDNVPRLFDFPNWRQGGLDKLNYNRRQTEDDIAAAETPEDRIAGLMRLAFLYFANNFGQETLAVLRLVESENADMAKNPNFIALQGAANAMAGHYAEAIRHLSHPAIQQHPEVSLWIGYAAAATEQWRMANRSFPGDNSLLLKYPDGIAIPFTLYMAESALRVGQTDTARSLLSSISVTPENLSPHYRAALEYLRGETFRQEGDAKAAIRVWKPVEKGMNRLYHTKAGLALANLMLQENEISRKEAIDRIDSLRFAWRGDGLEVQILHNLGSLKVEDSQYLAGLQDMETAAKLADRMLADSAPIREDMQRIYSDLFVSGNAPDDLQPLEAVTIYNEFSKLLPPGTPAAVTADLRFADHMMRMDLLDRAEAIYENALHSGSVTAADIPAVSTRLAAAYILDGKPERAIAVLDRTAAGGQGAERLLLKARAQSQLGRTDEAIRTLADLHSDDARKLKVDVLWRAGKWLDAATAIGDFAPLPDKVEEGNARLILNMAVATKLSGDAQRLESLKSRYAAAMAGTRYSDTFGVVTRGGGASSLSDRETILKIAGEVDMFKGFLDSYKSGEKPDEGSAGG